MSIFLNRLKPLSLSNPIFIYLSNNKLLLDNNVVMLYKISCDYGMFYLNSTTVMKHEMINNTAYIGTYINIETISANKRCNFLYKILWL